MINNLIHDNKYKSKIYGNVNVITLSENESIEKVPVKFNNEYYDDIFYKINDQYIFLGRYLKFFKILDIEVKDNLILISLKTHANTDSCLVPIKILTLFNREDCTLINEKERYIAELFFGDTIVKYLLEPDEYLYSSNHIVKRKIK